MANKLIELTVVCSNEVKKRAGLSSGNTVPWQVDRTLPFFHDNNYGKLTQKLQIDGQCELCTFAEGTVRDVIDTTKTPEELGFRSRNSVYLRLKRTSRAGTSLSAVLGFTLTAEEERLFKKLRSRAIPNLTPDDPCPLCTRTVSDEGGPQAPFNAAASTTGTAPSASMTTTLEALIPKMKGEIGVQCGHASRLGEPPVLVDFGSASRMKSAPVSSQVQDFGLPVTAGGAPFVEFGGEIVTMKEELNELRRERDQLKIELREATRQLNELERWKREHRCDTSTEVVQMRKEMEAMQCNLRDLMRHREEVVAELQRRRSSGLMYGQQNTPNLSFSVPSLGQGSPRVDPQSLLSKTMGELHAMPSDQSYPAASPQGAQQQSVTMPSTIKRPSGTDPSMSPVQPPIQTQSQTPGQCLLRVQSGAGDPFFVKRKIDSQLRKGKNILTFASLDGVVTDEIFVDELETVSVQGTTEMKLQTSQYEWVVYLNPNERERWVHWLFALSPWLSAQRNVSAIPNSF